MAYSWRNFFGKINKRTCTTIRDLRVIQSSSASSWEKNQICYKNSGKK